MKKLTTMVIAGAFAVAASGCYGPFALTKKVYNINGQVGSRWANEGVFLVFAILPVYGISILGDAIIFNSIQFWTGNNPIASKSLENGNQRVVMTYNAQTKRLRIDTFEKDRPAGTVIIQAGANGDMTATTQDGQVLSSKANADGTITISRADGKILGNYDPQTIKKYFN